MPTFFRARAASVSPPVSDGAKRKALLVAVGYKDLHESLREKYPEENYWRLPGAHKDPPKLKKLLIEKYGYRDEDITILMDDGMHKKPTRQTMINELTALVRDANPGDHFVFHFSGHGSQVENMDGREDDGFDEVIWPSDIVYDPSQEDEHLKARNYIIDDELKMILVDNLPDYAHLTVLFDCCHSGTSLDLPYHKAINKYDSQWQSPVEDKPPKPIPFVAKVKRSMSMGPHKPPARRCPTRNTTAGSASRQRVRGSNSLKMPHTTRGVLNTNGSYVLEENDRLVAEPQNIQGEERPVSKAHVTSWSACMDNQLGIDSKKGGILTLNFDKILRKRSDRTNKEMLEELSHGLFKKGKKAKRYFRLHNLLGGDDLPQPKPCLGSLQPLNEILEKKFTF